MAYLVENSIFWKFGAAFLLLAGVFLAGSQCHASLIVSPVSFSNNTMGVWSGNSGANTPATVIDQSGLSATFTSGATNLASYLATDPTHVSANGTPTTFWNSDGIDGLGTIDFDLGNTFSITDFVLWQNDQIGPSFQASQVKDFRIFTSTDASFTSSTNVGMFTATAIIPPTGSDPHPSAELFNLTPSVGRFARLEILSTQGDSAAVAIGELTFGVIPEPTSFALFGIAMLGMARRRRLK